MPFDSKGMQMQNQLSYGYVLLVLGRNGLQLKASSFKGGDDGLKVLGSYLDGNEDSAWEPLEGRPPRWLSMLEPNIYASPGYEPGTIHNPEPPRGGRG